MPSKKSKASPKRRAPWRDEPNCSESRLREIAVELARELNPPDRVLLEGPMGAGKSTFARALLHALGVSQPPEGSPTFAIAHEYDSPRGGVVHIDLYRFKSEAEIEEAGIPAYFWERDLIGIVEWASAWPDFERVLLAEDDRKHVAWRVELSFTDNPEARAFKITRL